jgi:hypothetical protein
VVSEVDGRCTGHPLYTEHKRNEIRHRRRPSETSSSCNAVQKREMSSIYRSSVNSNVASEVDDRCGGQWMDGLVKGVTSACVVRDRMVVIN